MNPTVQDVVGVEIGLVLVQDGLEVGGAVADLIVTVQLAAGQQNLRAAEG